MTRTPELCKAPQQAYRQCAVGNLGVLNFSQIRGSVSKPQ